ncbi:MAG: hypothetical protein AAGU05_01180, partial [Anaerolineaceae bacterium]
MTELVLYNNRLTGYIPSEIGNLVQLKYLDLDANWLTANIPDEMLNLKNLEEFYFKYDGPCLTNKQVFHRWMEAIPSHSNYMICKAQTELDSVQPGYSLRGISIPKLVVAGYYFQPKSVVDWNGNALQTTYFNPNKLTAEVPAEVIDEPGLIYVLVCTIDMVNICSFGKSHIILDFTPANNQKLTTNKVTFDWDDVPGANLYTIQLSLSKSFSSNILYTTTSASKYAFGTALTNGKTYYWRIQARIGSTWGPWTSTAQFISMSPPAAPGLTAPAAGASTNDTTVDLSWKTVTNGQVYQLQLSKSSTFGTLLVNETLAAGVIAYTTAELADGLYYWRVRGIDEVGVNGAWSAARSFTVDTIAPGVPRLYTPKDGANTADITPDLTLTAVAGAKNYTYQLSGSPEFGEIAWEKTGGVLLSTSAQPYGVYYWRARAVDAAGNASDWSGARQITLTFLGSPGAGAVTTDSTPAFVWTAVTGAKGYELNIYRQGESEPLYTKSLGLVTTFTLPNTNALPIGYYQWGMRVTLSSGVQSTPLRDLTIKPAPPAAPGLTSPGAGAATNDNTPTLRWNAAAVALGYELWLDNGSGFTSREYQNTFEAGVLEVTLESALPDGLYYWKMRTLTEMGVVGPWSAVRSFTVDTLAPGVPKLYTPKDVTSTPDTTPTLTLTAVSGAKRYTYQLSNSATFDEILFENTTTSLTATVTPAQGYANGYYWRAKAIDAAGNESDWSAAWRLEITFLSTPKAGWYSTTRTPAFIWTAVTGAKGYELRIYREGESEPVYTKSLGLVTSFTLPLANALPPGKYRYGMSVKLASGTFAAAERPFTLTAAYLPAPGSSAPANGAAMQNRTPELVWNAVAGAVAYEIWLDNGSGFTSREFSLITPETAVVLPTELPDGTYYWKVRSIDDLDVPGPWGVVRTLKVDNIAPAAPKLYSPAGGAVVTGTPRFTWLASSGAKYYQFQLVLKSDGSVVRQSADTLTGTGYTPSAVPAGEYLWQMRAGDAAGNWSGWGT